MPKVPRKKTNKGIKIKGKHYGSRKQFWKSQRIHKYDINDAFYKDNFFTPRDNITQRYRTVMQTPHYKNVLPEIMHQGLANMQEKEEYNMLNVPLFSLIKSGAYEKDNANYDADNTKDTINFFLNNLPSFSKYKKHDELDWIIAEHRLLAVEILEHYAKQERPVSPSTLGTRFNIILRVMRIAYDNKKAPIYKLYSTIVFALKAAVAKKEGENALNIYEKDKYIHWKDVLYVQDTMEKEFAAMKDKMTQAAYDLNNDLILISLYSLIPPERNEIKFLEFSRHPRKNDKDYIYVSKNMDRVVLQFNDIKKQHDPVSFDLSNGEYKNERLSNIIVESLRLYPRDYVFTLKKKYPDVSSKVSKRGLDERLYNIFFRYGIKNKISVNSLRSSHISYILSKKGTNYNDKEKLAELMRTSVYCLEVHYNKVKTAQPILASKSKKDELDKINENTDEDNDSDDSNEEHDLNDYQDDDINYDEYNHSDMSEKSESSYKSVRSHISDKSDKSSSSEKSDKSDKSSSSEKSDKSSSSEKSDKSSSSDNPDKLKIRNNAMVDCVIKCCQNNNKNKAAKAAKAAKKTNDDDNDESGSVDKVSKIATQYKRKLLKAKEWYVNNREEVIEKTREYKEKMTPFEKTRERICQLLNASPDYAEKIRGKTIEKYKFYYNEDKERWTWEGRK